MNGADYYFIICKKWKKSISSFSYSLSPSLLPSLLSSLASSAVWSMGRGQVAKRVQPSLPPPPPRPPPSTSQPSTPPLTLPSRQPPVQLCRSPQVPARSDVQHERQHVPLLTAVYHAWLSRRRAHRYGNVQHVLFFLFREQSRWWWIQSRFTAEFFGFWQVGGGSEMAFTAQYLCTKTQTNEVPLIKHSFIAGFIDFQRSCSLGGSYMITQGGRATVKIVVTCCAISVSNHFSNLFKE